MNVVDLSTERQLKTERQLLAQLTARSYTVKRLALEDWLRESLKQDERKRKS